MQTVCLVGKPNVGKSSIFNRLIKENKSIIMDTPGVTRDRIYGRVNYSDKSFYLIDTGGISLGDDDFAKDILVQATLAIDEADLVLFVVDGNDDPDASDKKVAEILHKSSKKVIVVVNKIDNDKKKENLYNYYELGFSDLVAVSASHNIGFDGLLNTITSDLPEEVKTEDNSLKFCIIGRPNVGKSSLINAILNEEKGKIYESVEKYSLIRSLKAIDRSDVCVLVIDASTGIIEHDKHIASYALDAGKGIVICVNKWDTINNPDSDIRKWKEDIKNEFQFIPYAHTVFLSAKTKKRLSGLMPEVINAYNNNRKEVKTSLLNNIIMEAVSMHEPPSYKGKRLKIYFVSQTGTCPPKFTFSVNNKGLVHFSYERYLENQIRNNIDFDGTPIMLQFKNKSEK